MSTFSGGIAEPDGLLCCNFFLSFFLVNMKHHALFLHGIFLNQTLSYTTKRFGDKVMIRFVLLTLILLFATPAFADVRVLPDGTVPRGFSPGIVIEGLERDSAVRIHAYASYERWEAGADGRWVPKSAIYHAWADVRADSRGRVAMDQYTVAQGTYTGADGYGLLWSMRKPTDPAVVDANSSAVAAPSPKPGTIALLVTQNKKLVANGNFRFTEPAGLSVVNVAEGRLHGTYAYPVGKKRLPVIILLHGSEGGGADEARAMATRFAGQGYAAFALNYFAWDLKGLKGPPNYHVNQPIELVAQTRDWLAKRPEINIRRLGLYGHSKGAEYAALAASYYPWIKSVVACVPSDAVWEGYGIGDGRNKPDPTQVWPEQRSSWSWQGKPLPYIPLYSFESRKWFDNTERYSVSRSDHPLETVAARIPIEQSRARLLLLGGERDEVWASGTMAKNMGAQLRAAGRGKQAIVQVYAGAGHQICGDGTYPTHIWADASPDPRVKDPVAEGAAAADAWNRIKLFMKRSL
jgi:dienelactone hydrolase